MYTIRLNCQVLLVGLVYIIIIGKGFYLTGFVVYMSTILQPIFFDKSIPKLTPPIKPPPMKTATCFLLALFRCFTAS